VTHGAVCARCNAWRGSLGLEPTPELFVAHLVEVFRAVRRVLREDGTCWVNLGDCYARQDASGGGLEAIGFGYGQAEQRRNLVRRAPPAGLKNKDLVGIPWRVAFALQADGWYLRSEIIWHKPNPMPESVTDRPTKAHEQLFLLAKSPRYYYDGEAIREPQSELTLERFASGNQRTMGHKALLRDKRDCLATYETSTAILPYGRSKRSVWTIPSAPFSEAHFATFPPALVEPCVKAGTSARGACPACGAPWRREVERLAQPSEAWHFKPGDDPVGRIRPRGKNGDTHAAWKALHPDTTLGWAPTCACGPGLAPGVVEPCVQAGTSERGCCAQCGAPWRREVERTDSSWQRRRDNGDPMRYGLMGSAAPLHRSLRDPADRAAGGFGVPAVATTTGWAPTCACAPDPKACVVLDPFSGAGTVGLVADRLGRDAILVELKESYARMSLERIHAESPLFADVTLKPAASPGNGTSRAIPEQLALELAVTIEPARRSESLDSLSILPANDTDGRA
jgi:DNA modification methylase